MDLRLLVVVDPWTLLGDEVKESLYRTLIPWDDG